MDENMNSLNQEDGTDAEDVVNGGVGVGDAEEQGAQTAEQGVADKDDPYGVKKRLGMQAKKHQREMRQMQEQLMQMQSQLGSHGQNQYGQQDQNVYNSPGQPNPPNMSEQEKIQMAVRMALGHKEDLERQAKDAERQAHISKQYQRLQDEFDKASDKYEDFDELVRGNDVPFTSHMRDALLLVDNPSDVAYELGKNREKLERISNLHPLDQAREVNKLSFALMSGAGNKNSAPQKSNPMGSVRVNPASNSSAVTDKTPAASIRARMKAGTWK